MPRRIYPWEYNGQQTDSLRAAKDSTRGAYEDTGLAPRDARVIDPLDGSNLMRETRGKIFLLFPWITDDGICRFWGTLPAAAAGDITQRVTHNVVGTSLTWFLHSMGGNTSYTNFFPVFRLKKNGIYITEWLPIASAQRSPMWNDATAAPATLTAGASLPVIPPTLPTYLIDFDQVEVWNPPGGGQINYNALITDGSGFVLMNAGGNGPT